ncbi:hypothetical protein J2Z47_000874 [Cohnella thailandensis]|nr:hypothetical protein [Cohnella thailandensis]
MKKAFKAGKKAGKLVQGIRLERLDRGLLAVSVPEGVFLSWRFLREEATGYSDRGLTGTDFRVYRMDCRWRSLEIARTIWTARALRSPYTKLERLTGARRRTAAGKRSHGRTFIKRCRWRSRRTA